jgi:putative flippase GtrA
LPELGRFSVVYSVVFVANLGLLAVAVEVIGLPVMLSQMVIGMGLVVGSYTVNRLWTFRHGRSVSHEGMADAGKATTIRAGQAPGDQGSGR